MRIRNLPEERRSATTQPSTLTPKMLSSLISPDEQNMKSKITTTSQSEDKQH